MQRRQLTLSGALMITRPRIHLHGPTHSALCPSAQIIGYLEKQSLGLILAQNREDVKQASQNSPWCSRLWALSLMLGDILRSLSPKLAMVCYVSQGPNCMFP